MNKTIAIVDDDKKIAGLIDFRLKRQGYETHCLYRGLDAVKYIREHQPVLVMLDIRLPDISGMEILKQLRETNVSSHFIMISAHADIKLAVECMKLGAYDFIEKPLTLPELDAKVKHVFDQFKLIEEVTMLKRELGEKYKYKSLVGKGVAMQKVFECIDIAGKNAVDVLIDGESGTGKELVARAIHFNDPEKAGPFVAVNCGAIPDNLLESELFGYEKGAFSGASQQKTGKFELAHGGTIFLDEIGELPLPLQVKLLRVLQEREIERVGGAQPIPIKVRFIFATNRNLKKHVSDGAFREDLYFRMNVFPIRVPPLRDRKDDIPELLQYFIGKHQHRGQAALTIESGALKRMMEYRWPGNIRELENFVERLFLIKGAGSVVSAGDLDFFESFYEEEVPAGMPNWGDKDKVIGDTEKFLLKNALKEAGGNVSKASKILQISRDTFYRKMKKYTMER